MALERVNVRNGGKIITHVTRYPDINVAACIYNDDSREEMELSVFEILELL